MIRPLCAALFAFLLLAAVSAGAAEPWFGGASITTRPIFAGTSIVSAHRATIPPRLCPTM